MDLPSHTLTPAAGTAAADRRAPAAEHFGELLDAYRRRFDGELAGWIGRKRAQLAMVVPEAEELAEGIERLAASGGKRLRPALVDRSWRLCRGLADGDAEGGPGGEGAAAGIGPLAMSTELLHTYLLIHDDIMDHAPLRRGLPSAHAELAERHRRRGWPGDPADFGATGAILMGDLAYTWANERFHEACRALPESPAGARFAELARVFAAMAEEVIGGQYLEIVLARGREAGEEALGRVLRLKSGRYTVERPLELGAVYAGAPAAIRAALGRYGRAVGEAFQLQDDVLGTFGERHEVGKPVAGDLAEGKLTFLVHHALRLAEPAAADRLRSGLGRADLDEAEIEALRAVIRDSGALARVRETIAERLGKARQALAELAAAIARAEGGRGVGGTGDGEHLDFLTGLVDYVAERRR